MNPEHEEPGVGGREWDAEDLDGHTIEELSDYLDAGRTPRNESIERSARSRIALDALQRLRRLTPRLMEEEAAKEERPDEGWVRRILSSISSESRAGRRIPLAAGEDGDDLGITEGAVRGVIRAAESAIGGVVVGRCRLVGDVTAPGEEIRAVVDASVLYGIDIRGVAQRLRDEVRRRLNEHTDLNVVGVDVRVKDVHASDPGEGDA